MMHPTETLQEKAKTKEPVLGSNPHILPTEKGRHILHAMNHAIRQQILELLYQQGRMTETEVYRKLRLEHPVASLHLSALNKAGFVTTENDGGLLWYTVNYNQLKEVRRCSGLLWHI